MGGPLAGHRVSSPPYAAGEAAADGFDAADVDLEMISATQAGTPAPKVVRPRSRIPRDDSPRAGAPRPEKRQRSGGALPGATVQASSGPAVQQPSQSPAPRSCFSSDDEDEDLEDCKEDTPKEKETRDMIMHIAALAFEHGIEIGRAAVSAAGASIPDYPPKRRTGLIHMSSESYIPSASVRRAITNYVQFVHFRETNEVRPT